jgi:hypothetical protein
MGRSLIRLKDVVVSAAIGISLVLVLFSVIDTRAAGSLARVLLLPGAVTAGMVGLGAHDFGGFLLYIIGDVVFYSIAPMLVFVLVEYQRRDK